MEIQNSASLIVIINLIVLPEYFRHNCMENIRDTCCDPKKNILDAHVRRAAAAIFHLSWIELTNLQL